MSATFDPIDALAKEAGVTVTSHVRPNATTSSGNVSLHATGQAKDYSGSASAMAKFFASVRAAFGSKLDELIYTPQGDRQIKNGQGFKFTGSVAADHYDHVHVGYTGKYGALAKGSASAQANNAGVLTGITVTQILGGQLPSALGQEAGKAIAGGENPVSAVQELPKTAAQAAVDSIVSGLSAEGPRLLLEVALILGGAVLVLWGVLKISGVKPSTITKRTPIGAAL